MPEPVKINLEDYEYSEPMRFRDFPWPRIQCEDPGGTFSIPLKEEYLFRTMDFLDSTEALPIYTKQADLIIEHNIKRIVDCGCRHGPVLDILWDRGYITDDFEYMGFDTSPQPIALASERWQHFENIEFRVASMWDKSDISVNFDVECVIWSGILLYAQDHAALFHDLTVKFYGAQKSIIQEPCGDQDPEKFLPWLELHTIDLEIKQYANNYTKYKDWIVDTDIFQGRRRICLIWI